MHGRHSFNMIQEAMILDVVIGLMALVTLPGCPPKSWMTINPSNVWFGKRHPHLRFGANSLFSSTMKAPKPWRFIGFRIWQRPQYSKLTPNYFQVGGVFDISEDQDTLVFRQSVQSSKWARYSGLHFHLFSPDEHWCKALVLVMALVPSPKSP